MATKSRRRQPTEQKRKRSELDHRGFEIPDSRPMAVPVGFRRPPTIQEMVRNLIRTEVSRQAQSEGNETFEEADDFEVGDEPELASHYELDDEQERASMREFVEEKPIERPQKKNADGPPKKDGPPPPKAASGTAGDGGPDNE